MKRDIIKTGAKLAVGVGVGAIVGNAVAFTSPVIGVGLAMKGAIGLGSFVLSNMIGDKASEYAEEKIDEVFASVDELTATLLKKNQETLDEIGEEEEQG